MALYPFKDLIFQITDTGGGLRDVSPYLTDASLKLLRELIDSVAAGDGGYRFQPGLQKSTIELDFLWSEDANVGPDVVFGGLYTHTAATAWDMGAEGKSTGDIKYSGNCWVESWEITGKVAGLMSGHASIKIDNTVTRGTYA